MTCLSVNRPLPIGGAISQCGTLPGMSEAFRRHLDRLIKAREITYADCSKQIGKNHAYIQQYIDRGKPRYLHTADLEALEEYLGQEPGAFEWGRRGFTSPANSQQIADKEKNQFRDRLALIPEVNVQPGMGNGAVVDPEFHQGAWGIMRDYLSAIVRLSSPANARIVEVNGDSMEPTLRSGDRVMVDTGNKQLVPGEIYAIRDDLTDTVMVKRLARATEGDPTDRRIRVISDNSERASHILPIEAIIIIGRVVWMARRM